MKLCKTCGVELSFTRKLGQLEDFCSIGCSNKDVSINNKRAKTAVATRLERKNYTPERTLYLNREDLKLEIIKRSSARGMSVHSAKNLCLKPEILAHTDFLKDANWNERIFCVKNDITELQLCCYCEKQPVSFSGQNIPGYFKFCSQECAANDPSTKSVRAQTNLVKYGDAVAFRNSDVKLKQSRTIKSRYGVTNSWHLSKHSGFSKISQELFWNVWHNSKQHGQIYFGELTGELRLCLDGKVYKPDYAQIDGNDKRIIEFDGDYWHTNDSKIADDIRENSLVRDGWKILRIRESVYLKDKEEAIIKCIAFMNKDIE